MQAYAHKHTHTQAYIYNSPCIYTNKWIEVQIFRTNLTHTREIESFGEGGRERRED